MILASVTILEFAAAVIFSAFAIAMGWVFHLSRRAASLAEKQCRQYVDRVRTGSASRTDALARIEEAFDEDPNFLTLRRMAIAAPLLGVLITAAGFYWSDFTIDFESTRSSPLTIIAHMQPLFLGVLCGALLALINQVLLTLADRETQAATTRLAGDLDLDSPFPVDLAVAESVGKIRTLGDLVTRQMTPLLDDSGMTLTALLNEGRRLITIAHSAAAGIEHAQSSIATSVVSIQEGTAGAKVEAESIAEALKTATDQLSEDLSAEVDSVKGKLDSASDDLSKALAKEADAVSSKVENSTDALTASLAKAEAETRKQAAEAGARLAKAGQPLVDCADQAAEALTGAALELSTAMSGAGEHLALSLAEVPSELTTSIGEVTASTKQLTALLADVASTLSEAEAERKSTRASLEALEQKVESCATHLDTSSSTMKRAAQGLETGADRLEGSATALSNIIEKAVEDLTALQTACQALSEHVRETRSYQMRPPTTPPPQQTPLPRKRGLFRSLLGLFSGDGQHGSRPPGHHPPSDGRPGSPE